MYESKNISCRDIAAFGWYMILYDNILTHFRETWKMGDHPARFWAGGWSGTIDEQMGKYY